MIYRLKLNLSRDRGGANGWEENLQIFTREPFSTHEKALDFAQKRLNELNEQARQYGNAIWNISYINIEGVWR